MLELHLAATWFMAGVIWVVQVLHYPMLGRVGAAFDDCQKFHLSRTGAVVGPPMLIEGVTGAALLWRNPGSTILWAGMALLFLIWISTAFVQVPRHNRLACGWDPRAHRELVSTNWLRTICWSARALLLTFAI